MASIAERRRAFRALHASGCFLLPNPVRHRQRALSAASRLSGPRHDQRRARLVARPIRCGGGARRRARPHPRPWSMQPTSRSTPISNRAMPTIRTGLPRASACASRPGWPASRSRIATGDKAKPLYDLAQAVERIKAARAAIDAAGGDTILVARSECFLVGHPEPLKEAIRRLQRIRRGRSRLPLRPGSAAARRYRRDRQGGRTEAGQRPRRRADRPDARRSRRARRAAGQRRRRRSPASPGAPSCARRRS